MKTYTPVYGNDLALARNKRGKLDLVLESDSVVASVIKLYFRFLFFKGEWFLNTLEGMPWFEYIFVKNPNMVIVEHVLRKLLLSVPTIQRIDTFELDYDAAKRRLSFFFECTALDGRKISGGSGKPFIIDDRDIAFDGAS